MRPPRRLLTFGCLAAATALVALIAPIGDAAAYPVPGDGSSLANAAPAGIGVSAAAGIGVSGPAGIGVSGPAGIGVPAAAAPNSPVSVDLVSTSPIAPAAQATDTTVTVLVNVTNNSDATLSQVQIRGVRDSPIIRQSALDQMLGHPVPPTDATLTQPMPTLRYPATIPAHSSMQLTYQFPASTARQSGGVCLCQSGIYPIDLTTYAATNSRDAATQVGWLQTYLVSATQTPATEKVSWLWPLLDRPHRSSDTSAFLDDDLGAEVAPGGRLDRALQVLEQVSATSRVTVVIDPELIDELAQMTTGYRVEHGSTTVAGTEGTLAAAWLQRLRTVIATLPITFTPYADPAVNAVTAAQLSWSSDLPVAMANRIQVALGRTVTPGNSSLAWPPGETLTPAALSQLAEDGTSTVVLNDTALPGGSNANPPLPAVATVPVPNSANSVHALVTSAPIEQRIATILDPAGSQLATLPALLSELALHTLQDSAQPSYLVMIPGRYADVTPSTAAALITATTQSAWAAPLAAAEAATTITPADHGSLVAPDSAHYGGSAELITRAGAMSTFIGDFSSAIAPTDLTGVLGTLPGAIQTAESAGWSQDPAAANAYSSALGAQTATLTGDVQLVRPSNGSYSLASANAPLLVTVVNDLPVPVSVQVTFRTVGGVAGFRTDDSGIQLIPANSRRTIKLQAHVARSGHFRVQAQLLTPAGGALGPTMPLTIYSSALGTIGVVITVVAAAVLLLALIYRFTRRWLHHRELIRRMMAEEARVPAGARG